MTPPGCKKVKRLYMAIRVHKLAKEVGLSSKDLIERLRALKVDVKGHMSSLDDETAELVRQELGEEKKRLEAEEKKREEAALKTLEAEPSLTVKALAVKLS